MSTRDQAICLRTADYSETSQVVCFLARDAGVVRLIAKGAKRPKSKTGGAIDLLSEGDLVFTTPRGESLGTLIEFTESHSRGRLRRDAGKLNVALYMIELAGEMLAEGDPHPEVFDLLHSGLARLAEADAPAPAVLAFYQWQLLKRVGLLGELSGCVSCGQEIVRDSAGAGREVYFCSDQGGLLCRDCEAGVAEKYRLDGAALAGLAVLGAAGQPRPRTGKITMPDAQAHAANRMLAYHVTQLIHKPLKLARHAIPPGSKRRSSR